MSPRVRLRRYRRRFGGMLRRVLLLGLFGGALMSLVTYGAVKHTAEPEFCYTCHIMEPYFESWVNSSHKDVACIDCHYEPGVLETAEGKFKALSQLAKYVTRTQGTKPWAEVSDQSCMRSGCHSVRLLDGPIQYGDVKFDHRHHLLESRRGRRLRCVTCHSQNDPSEHVSVTDSTCFMCHFMPDQDGKLLEKTSDCLVCHGPPTKPVLVGDHAFSHTEYVERGVNCRECHDPVIKGKGEVRKERCHSCHAEVGHIERFGDSIFLHEMHVTEHKVECYECHDQIDHGLLPLDTPETQSESSEGCVSCHRTSHDSARMLYAGVGAVGIDPDPSRMYETRVVCRACHTGRAGFQEHGSSSNSQIDPHQSGHFGPRVATASAVDCIHCHGPAFKGILEEWQAAVGEQLDRLGPLLDEAEARVAGQEEEHHEQGPLADARINYSLVEKDRSRGVHNPRYALDALRFSAERIDQAARLLDPTAEPQAVVGFPLDTALGCSECHVAMGRPPSISLAERVFPHTPHLTSGMDCDACHGPGRYGELTHGTTSISPNDCSSCHHQESEAYDVEECSECHGHQENFLFGEVLDLEDPPVPHEDMDCVDCHGDPPDITMPSTNLCVLCHDETYVELYDTIRASTRSRLAEADSLLEQAGARLDEENLAMVRARLEVLRQDGSGGIHNPELTETLLKEALDALSSDSKSP